MAPSDAPHVEQPVDASSSAVWSVLADGWLYTGWVVGASHIRAVDATWPDVGSSIHHAVGGWPVLVKDHTDVVESIESQRLVLRARAWPFGEAQVTLTITPQGEGCLVRMAEEPTRGPARWVHNPVQEKVLLARNRESLERLRAMAEGREHVA